MLWGGGDAFLDLWIGRYGAYDMVEKIEHDGQIIAIIVPRDFHNEGVTFFSPSGALLQIGYMSHPSNYKITAHVHRPLARHTEGTNEVLFIKSGRVRVDFYDASQHYVTCRELRGGDWVVLMEGGHGFEMLEPTVMIEVKNGPYAGENDKVKFSANGV